MIRQEAGSGRFRIRPRDPSEDRPTIETPSAALVVKGTVFDLTVGANGTEVVVEQGLVTVSQPATGSSLDVRSGERARQPSDPGAGARLDAAPGGTGGDVGPDEVTEPGGAGRPDGPP